MAGKVRFVGSVQHTEDTLQRLGILAQLAVGFAMAALALTVEMSRPLQGVLLLVGCLVMVSGDLPASLRADKAVDSRKGSLPKNVCSFFEDRMELSGEGSMRLEYGRFQRLIEDDGYLYLFLGRGSVCMIDPRGIEGLHGPAHRAGLAAGEVLFEHEPRRFAPGGPGPPGALTIL